MPADAKLASTRKTNSIFSRDNDGLERRKIIQIIKSLNSQKVVKLSVINVGLGGQFVCGKEQLCVDALVNANFSWRCMLNKKATFWINKQASKTAKYVGDELFCPIIDASNPTKLSPEPTWSDEEEDARENDERRGFCWYAPKTRWWADEYRL